MLKIPAFISNKVERNGDNCILTLTTKQAKIATIVGSILIIAALVLGIWGIVRQAEVMQLRQQTQLQSEQLKLLQQKTDVLDKKIQNLNQNSMWGNLTLTAPGSGENISTESSLECLRKVVNYITKYHDIYMLK